jgi:hypothetical protein
LSALGKELQSIYFQLQPKQERRVDEHQKLNENPRPPEPAAEAKYNQSYVPG